MNLFIGILKSKTTLPLPTKFDLSNLSSALPKQKLLWQPDHEGSYHTDHLGLACFQRYITPECARQPMPYYHQASGCVIAGDIFLTNRSQLISQLHCSNKVADCELVLLSYLKWDEACTKYLIGNYVFSIWNPTTERLTIATDNFATRPCFYTYQLGEFFIFSNVMHSVASFRGKVSLNQNLFARFTLDLLPNNESSFAEISKTAPAEIISVTKRSVERKYYWNISDIATEVSYLSDTDYYTAFRELFSQVCDEYLRTPYPISAHISGGLDSSSVAAMVAKKLSRTAQTLYGFTAIPKDLVGESHRKNWHYNEVERIQALIDKYPNISLKLFETDPNVDPYLMLENLYPFTDQPFRNISNLNWIIASYDYAAENDSRILLNGQHGNGTISWKGDDTINRLKRAYYNLKNWFYPEKTCSQIYDYLCQAFIESSNTRSLIRQRMLLLNIQECLLSRKLSVGLNASSRALSLYYGIEFLDPTADLRIVEFCYQLPHRIFRTGPTPQESRLLVRNGLKDILPESIRLNRYRGEQSADWYLQYNLHASGWMKKFEDYPLSSCVWNWFDRNKIVTLMRNANKSELLLAKDLYSTVFRCLSLVSYLTYAEQACSKINSFNK